MILHTRGRPHGTSGKVMGRVTFEPIKQLRKRRDYILLSDDTPNQDTNGYAAILTDKRLEDDASDRLDGNRGFLVHSVANFDALRPGQVLVVDGRTGFIRILFRPGSEHNFIFATDRCNSRCLMCSQPPRDVDDRDRIQEHLRLVELIDPATKYLGITGGEPTLLGDDFLKLIRKCRDSLPRTDIHVLTNGRLFYYEGFAKALGEIAHPRLTLGIPLYSDIDREHDCVVQAEHAFDQTVLGLFNLAKHQQSVEIRVVLHSLTHKRLPQLATFLYRNFPFASHIAFMGLEMVGYAKANLELLWIDPFDYQNELEAAVSFLVNRRMHVSIYNHQLCVLKRSLWPFARKSISDWKNHYLAECDGCSARDRCGRFFATGIQRPSAHIGAIGA